jgi:hypothetical protein
MWCIRGNPAFKQFEWVASTLANKVDRIFQIFSPQQGHAFMEVQLQLFAPCTHELIDITGLELKRIRVVATARDLKDSKLNPGVKFLFPVWLIGLTYKLNFDPSEWKWISTGGEIPFFNYTAKIGYQAGMTGKCQESRMQEKCRALNLIDGET